MTSGRQVTPRNLERRISRLKPCPPGLEKVIEFINEVPPDIEIKDLKGDLRFDQKPFAISFLINYKAGQSGGC